MKKSLFILIGLSMSLYIVAQETKKQKEIGLVFSNLDNFGLTFKTGASNSLWRFTTLFISGSNQERTDDNFTGTAKNLNFGVGFKVGKEYRKQIKENLEVRLGADLSFNYNFGEYDFENNSSSFNEYRKVITYSPGINGVFGLNYVFNNNLILGAELMPYIAYHTSSTKEKKYNNIPVIEEITESSGFSYGISNSSVQLSLAYRF